MQQFSHNVIPRRNLVSGQFWQTVPRSFCLLSTDRLSKSAPQASPGAPHGGGLPAGPGLVPVGPVSAVRSVLLTEAIVRSQISISVVWHRSPGARAKLFLSGLWVDEGTGLGRLLDSEGQRSLQQGIRAMRPRPQCPFPSPAAESLGSLVCGLDFFQTALGEPNSNDLCQTNTNNNGNKEKRKSKFRKSRVAVRSRLRRGSNLFLFCGFSTYLIWACHPKRKDSKASWRRAVSCPEKLILTVGIW